MTGGGTSSSGRTHVDLEWGAATTSIQLALLCHLSDSLLAVTKMRRLGGFELHFEVRAKGKRRTEKKTIPIDLFQDEDTTIVELDCSCCPDLLANRLPGGVLIPVASAFKSFFERHGLRNAGVRVRGTFMRRTYRGVLDPSLLPAMKREVEEAVMRFSSRRREH